jgi:ABC-type bacteriocin/lantibiotic exporter with double-glycine peptidase domain
VKTLGLFLCLSGVVLAADKPGVWLDVPFVKQEKEGCGAASIAMVMQYWLRQQEKPEAGDDPAEIQRLLYSKKAHGIRASDVEKYFQEHGFRTFAFQGSWDDLRKHLEQGRPLIAALKPAERNAELHYVVVTGLDWEQHIVIMNDPAQRKLLKQDWTTFEKQWSAVGKWTLLAVPQPQPR